MFIPPCKKDHLNSPLWIPGIDPTNLICSLLFQTKIPSADLFPNLFSSLIPTAGIDSTVGVTVTEAEAVLIPAYSDRTVILTAI
jgi:hypothetical protein